LRVQAFPFLFPVGRKIMVRSLRFVSLAAVSLAVFAMCSTASAQPRPGGGRGMGMGMGMMGGGMRASVSMMYGILLNSATVQKDLDLLDEQKAKIKEITDNAQKAMRETFSKMGNPGDMTDEERAEMRKKMQAQGEKTTKDIEGVLLPDQLKRLKGIALQRMGVAALNDKGVQKELKLSDDQVAKLKTVGEDSMKKMRELFGSGEDRDAMRKKMQELGKDAEKKMMDVLSDEQKASLEKMKGKTLKIPDAELVPPGFRGRGNRGGAGGGGAPGGNPPPVN
jgi:Spy/CpxP family protein refolding chaperone